MGKDFFFPALRKTDFAYIIKEKFLTNEKVKQTVIYLDNSATTPILSEVREYIYKTMGETFGNPSSLYDLGIAAEKILTESRKTIGKTLNAKENEIYFTSCGSEGNNTAIKGIAKTYHKRGNHLITTAVEHPSVLRCYEDLEKEGFRITIIPVDSKGNPDMNQLEKSLTEDTILLSMMMVNNEVGTVFPLKETANLIGAKAPNCHFHVDGVQGYGRIPLDVKETGIDIFTLSGHKIGAPKGVGAIYIKNGIRLHPLIHGGGQEKGLRGGTENTYYIGALALAAKIATKNRSEKNQHLMTLKETFLHCLEAENIPYEVNGNVDENTVPYIANLMFPQVKAEVLLHYLEGEGIYVSQGSACHSKTKGTSETLVAIGKNDEERDSSLRFSFSDQTKMEDMPTVAAVLKQGTDMIREMRR